MTTTAMAEALTAAGYKPGGDRLLQIAIEAWGRFSGLNGGGQRRDYVAEKLQGELTWALVKQWQEPMLWQAIGFLLNRAEKEIKAARPINVVRKPTDDGGQIGGASQHSRAPVVTQFRDVAKPQAERRSEGASSYAIPKDRPPLSPSLKELADKQVARAAARVETEVRLSKLDMFTVNGRPIGDCTPNEIRGWLKSRHRDTRFAEMLIANLPPDRPVRDFIKGDEADKIYQRAEAQYAA